MWPVPWIWLTELLDLDCGKGLREGTASLTLQLGDLPVLWLGGREKQQWLLLGSSLSWNQNGLFWPATRKPCHLLVYRLYQHILIQVCSKLYGL